jgi:hypothetical protein
MYLKSLQELKQGSNVVYYSSFSIATSGAKMSTRQIKADLFLQLSADGKRVVGLPFQDDATSATPFIEFQVQDIVRIKLSDLSANRIYFHVELESQTITFTMSCKTITKHWVIGLICGATAMNPRKVRDLIWQAARLRICELTSKMEFIEAVKIVQEALEQLTQGDGYPPSILNHLLIQYTE